MMNDSGCTVKPHYIYITNLLYPYLTLLIIPVIRGLLQYLFGGKGALSAVLTAEAVLLCVAVFVAVLKLKRIVLFFDRSISVQKGLFCRVSYRIPPSASKVVVLESNPLLKILGAYRLKIYTEAGLRRRPDESILVRRADAARIYAMYKVKGETVRSNTYGDVIMSAALSSSTAGLLLSIPIIKVVLSVLGEEIPSLLPALNNPELSYSWLETVGKYLTLALMIGYAVSFTVLLLKNYGFSSVRSNGRIMLDSGRLPHKTAVLEGRSVNAVKVLTAPLMLLAGKCAVKFSACGYGRKKGEIGLLVPCVKPSLALGLVRWLLPEYKNVENILRPERHAVRRCVWLPLAALVSLVSAAIAVNALVPEFYEFVWLAALIATAFTSVLLFLRIYAINKGGFSLSNGQVWIKSLSKFSIGELQCKTDAVYFLRLSQTPFDRRHGHCTVRLQLMGKNHDTASVRYLGYSKAKELLRHI